MKIKLYTLLNFICLLSLGISNLAESSSHRLKDAEGHEVSLPEKPLRVVVLSEIDLDIILALGLKPVGAINGRGQKELPHYLQTEEDVTLAGIQIVGDLGRPNIESVVRLRPDLILTSPTRSEVLTLLRKVAPTFVTSKNGEHWKDVLQRVAKALQRDKEAEAFLVNYAKELQVAREKLSNVSHKTVSIIRWNPNGPSFMYQDAFASLVLREMGFERPSSQKIAGERHSMPLSLEALETIDAGWLFIGALTPTGDAVTAMHEVMKSSAFQRLSSVKDKRYFVVDGSKWTSIGGPLAALSIIKEVTTLISAQLHPEKK